MKLLILLGLVLPAMSREIGSFIIGGTDADIAKYPHQLSLRVNGRHSCGASLISQTRAITAAHCVGGTFSSYSILGGATFRQDETGPTSVVFLPTKIVSHPNFINSGLFAFANDIAVLIFDPVTFNVNFQPIAVASVSDGDFAGADCVITGWGRTNGTDSTSAANVLQQANVTVLTENDCRQKVSPFIGGGHVCVAAPTSGACRGDSGGPLVCRNILVGATSFGNGLCDPNIGPSVYTRLSYYLDFIASAQ